VQREKLDPWRETAPNSVADADALSMPLLRELERAVREGDRTTVAKLLRDRHELILAPKPAPRCPDGSSLEDFVPLQVARPAPVVGHPSLSPGSSTILSRLGWSATVSRHFHVLSLSGSVMDPQRAYTIKHSGSGGSERYYLLTKRKPRQSKIRMCDGWRQLMFFRQGGPLCGLLTAQSWVVRSRLNSAQRVQPHFPQH